MGTGSRGNGGGLDAACGASGCAAIGCGIIGGSGLDVGSRLEGPVVGAGEVDGAGEGKADVSTGTEESVACDALGTSGGVCDEEDDAAGVSIGSPQCSHLCSRALHFGQSCKAALLVGLPQTLHLPAESTNNRSLHFGQRAASACSAHGPALSKKAVPARIAAAIGLKTFFVGLVRAIVGRPFTRLYQLPSSHRPEAVDCRKRNRLRNVFALGCLRQARRGRFG